MKKSEKGNNEIAPPPNSKKGNAGQMKIDPRFKKMTYDPKFLPVDGRTTAEDPRFKESLLKSEFPEKSSGGGMHELYNFSSSSSEQKVPTIEDLKEISKKESEVVNKEFEFLDPREKDYILSKQEEEEKKYQDFVSYREYVQEQQEKNANNSAWDVIESSMSRKDNLEGVEVSNRFAVVNHDFNVVSIEDLYHIFSSFCLKGETVKSVTQYYSKFGEKEMSERMKNPPPKEIYEAMEDEDDESEEEEQQGEEEEEDDEEEEKKKQKKKKKSNLKVNDNALMLYEVRKLKSFFAVVEFSNSENCVHVYDECNGLDVEDTQQYLDLEIIPASKSFEDYIIAEGPFNGEKKKETNKEDDEEGEKKEKDDYSFQFKGQCKMFVPPSKEFLWDEVEEGRKRVLNSENFDKVPESEMLKYLNTDGDSDEEDEELMKEFRKVLLKENDEEEDDDDKEKEEEEKEEEKDDEEKEEEDSEEEKYDDEEDEEEIIEAEKTIEDQLSELGKKEKKKRKEGKESYAEQLQRKRKLKRKQRKKEKKIAMINARKEMEEEEEMNQANDEDLKKLIHEGSKVEKKMKFDISVDRRKVNQQKKGGEISKKKRKEIASSDSIDLKRFGQLVDDPDFNVDPSHSKFRMTKNTEKINIEKRKRKRDKTGEKELDDSYYYGEEKEGEKVSNGRTKRRKLN